MDSGFHAMDSKFFVSEIWIQDSNRKRDSGFLKLSSGFQSPGFRMPQAKIFLRLPEYGFPYMGQEQATLDGAPEGGGGGAIKESLGRAVPPRPSNPDPV